MAIPDFQSIMLPFMVALQDGKERTIGELTEALAVRFKLTDEERQELLTNGNNKVFSNRVAWAKTHLKAAGLIDNLKRGIINISKVGQKELGQKPTLVNCKFLKNFPNYQDWINHQAGVEGGAKGETADVVDAETPEARLEAAYQIIRNTLAEQVLDSVKNSSPQFFEQLVVELLVAMGYGGSLIEAGIPSPLEKRLK